MHILFPRIFRSWTFHNLLGHPLSELFHLGAMFAGWSEVALQRLSELLHDGTIPLRMMR